MANCSKIHFKIDHIDPLGQGVFKDGDRIYFIPKTLPGETGTANVLKSKKGVHFAQALKIEQKSEHRTESFCEHFQSCAGCHYQHCSYGLEIDFKLNTFKRMLSPLLTNLSHLQHSHNCVNVQVVQASERYHYRNRVQLHYNTQMQRLGFLDANRTIIEVPNCIIANDKVTKELKRLYLDKNWLLQAPKKQPKGHVEIYDHNGEVKITWNKSYAQGGFTQVNQKMNEKLNDLVKDQLQAQPEHIIFDLFGGNGNLSKHILGKKYVIDFYTPPSIQEDNRDFYHLDLYQENSHEIFKHSSKVSNADWFLIDPPRSGFLSLKQWCQEFSPQNIIYVSCHPQTMIRDLKKLDNYKVQKAFLIDLFPSTFHFEACVILKKC